MLFDAHCHLDCFENPKQAVLESIECGVSGFFSCSTNFVSMKKHLELRNLQGVRIALGLHPVDLLGLTEKQCLACLEFVSEHVLLADAVGEIGLDFKHAVTLKQKEFQEKFFEMQVRLAVEKNIAVIVHSRNAEKRVLELLSNFDAKRVLLHWFSGSGELIQSACSKGFFMSVGPVVLFSRQALQASNAIPLDLLLLETDSPVAFKGKPSRPFWVKQVAKKIAKERKISLETVIKKTGQNFKSLI